jgi:hypothetical protein
MYWPPRLEAKKRAKVPNKPGWYRCENCSQDREKIEIDHRIPCIRPVDGFTSWDAYINARFVENVEQLQALCHECHKEKSKNENQIRREKKHNNLFCQHDDPSWCTDSCPKRRRLK